VISPNEAPTHDAPTLPFSGAAGTVTGSNVPPAVDSEAVVL
jgi:hypothetical protein